MDVHLFQMRIEPSLKEKLQRIAVSKGLTMTSYVKMTLVEAAENDRDFALTENGFTAKEEKRLLKSVQEGEKEHKAGKLKKYKTISDALRDLDS